MVDSSETISFIKRAQIFSGFSDQELAHLAASCQTQHFEFGDLVVTAGTEPGGLFVIKSGRVRMFREADGKEKSLGLLGEGESLAEEVLVISRPVDFSARASGAVEVLFFPTEVVAQLLASNKVARSFVNQFLVLKITGGVVTQLFDLKKNKIERSEFEKLVKSVGAKKIKAGKVILAQDSAEDRRLYIVREGQVRIDRTENGKTYTLAQYGAKEVFGEKACLDYAVQPASVIAETDCVLIVIPQKTVEAILSHNKSVQTVLEDRVAFLDKEYQRQVKVSSLKAPVALLSAKGGAGLGGKLLKRFALVQQAEEMDCGAACLAMICKHHKLNIPLGKLREMAGVTAEGASMDSLAKVGEALGFSTKGVRCTIGSLRGFELPFIAHWEGYHYVVVYGVSKTHVWVADPGPGFRKMTIGEFEQGWTGNCMLFTATGNMAESEPDRSPWRRFLGYLIPLKPILRDLFIAALIMQLLGLVTPLIMQNILDKVIVHEDFDLLNMMILGLGVSMVFSQLTQLLSVYLSNFMVRKMDFGMMAHFYKHVLSMPIDFFAKRKTGDILARFQENETVRQFMTESSIGTILNSIMVVIYLGVMFQYNVTLTLVLLGFILPLGLLTLIITPKYKEFARQTFFADADAESLLMESLGGAETIKAMAVERDMRMKWEQKYVKSLDIKFRSELFSSSVGIVSEIVKATATIVILWLGVKMVLKQELSIGQLIAFNALVGSVMTPLLGLIGTWDELQEALVAMERLGDVLDMDPEQNPKEMASRVVLPDLDGDIVCSDVYFRYGDKTTPYILENVSMTIPHGSTVAIVGPSGSGKSTLAKVLVGLLKPTEGKISACGYDMNTLDMGYYRRHIGYVMQNNLLFAGTVSENIAMGDLNADQRRIQEAAKLADAHGFISNLQQGYEQVVGERGVGLSGGQMQRLCIARALYNEPQFLIFDEATSALDGETEGQIQRNMQEILQGKTAVIIAHRLSTVMNADQIFVLYDGRVTEQGTHKELLAQQGIYYQLVQKQLAVSQT